MDNFTRGQLQILQSRGFMTEKKIMTFAGGTVNDPGDHDGTGDPATLFTVTGLVQVAVYAVVATVLAGATATIEVGVTGDTASLIPQSTATDLAAGELWHDATPTTKIEAVTKTFKDTTLSVIQTVGTANITSGVLHYYCLWKPISNDANVVAA